MFFDLVQQDPVISQAKLIAEPWDVGPGGYQVGNFPPLWTEWNGKYRDTVRDFWRGEPGTLGEFASRLTGSSDLYQDDGRRPFASINFVTAHDGFTLGDLVSYNEKHNEANGEGNNDGESHNRSWNCGVEGPTDDAAILDLRARQQRNFITTLLLSQGVPMLLHGDEMGRTQRGNNNVYCQDSEIAWMDWSLAGKNVGLIGFTAGVSALRARAPGVPPSPVLRGQADQPGPAEGRPHGTAGHRLVHPGGPGDDRAGLGLRLRQVRHGVPERATASPRSTPGVSGSPTTRSCCASTPTTRTSRSRFPGRSTGRAGRSSSTPQSARCSPCPPSPAWWRPIRRRSRAGAVRRVPARSVRRAAADRDHADVSGLASERSEGLR